MNTIRALKILSKDTGRWRKNPTKPKYKRAYYAAPTISPVAPTILPPVASTIPPPVASKRTQIADLPVLLRLGLVVAVVLSLFFIIKAILTPAVIR